MSKRKKRPAPEAIDWSRELAKARRETARNTARINEGETFRAQKPPTPRRRRNNGTGTHD